MLPRKLEKAGGGHYVALDVDERVLDRRAHAGPRREVYHVAGLLAREDARDESIVAQVALVHPQAVTAPAGGQEGKVATLEAYVVVVVDLVHNDDL
jgi:hypothetical protein